MKPRLVGLGFLVALLGVAAARPSWGQATAERAGELARALLDEATPRPQREALIQDNAALSADLIRALTRDLGPATPNKELYRRIPWIWRVAIAAGRRNEADEIRKILAVSLPDAASPVLDDWRAVVVGGGLINGISQASDWPGARIKALVESDTSLRDRWAHALELAAKMADDTAVPTGTRYDALRFLGTETWERRGAQLFRYLLKGVHAELQMGAISGLADVPSDSTAQALLSGVEHYARGNLELALDALLREERRALALLDAVEQHRVSVASLGERRVNALREHSSQTVRTRAAKVLAP